MTINLKPAQLAVGISTLIIAILLIVVFTIIGSPMKERQLKMDQTRINALSRLQEGIQEYFNEYAVLPADLPSLQKGLQYTYSAFQIVDPETKTPFTYERLSDTTYKLCATFTTELTAEISPEGRTQYSYGYPYSSYNIRWDHGIGYHCFDMKVIPRMKTNPIKPLP